jgi:hypothetical protein
VAEDAIPFWETGSVVVNIPVCVTFCVPGQGLRRVTPLLTLSHLGIFDSSLLSRVSSESSDLAIERVNAKEAVNHA